MGRDLAAGIRQFVADTPDVKASEIAKALAVTEPAVVRSLLRLEASGRVTRKAAPGYGGDLATEATWSTTKRQVMPGPLDVLAISPEGAGVSIGPVYSEEAAMALALELRDAGWTPDGARLHMSRSTFRALAKEQSAPAAGGENG